MIGHFASPRITRAFLSKALLNLTEFHIMPRRFPPECKVYQALFRHFPTSPLILSPFLDCSRPSHCRSFLERMLDIYGLEDYGKSPTVIATAALVLISIAVQWYLNLAPKSKFPVAKLDQKDWHGSLMRAKSKVR